MIFFISIKKFLFLPPLDPLDLLWILDRVKYFHLTSFPVPVKTVQLFDIDGAQFHALSKFLWRIFPVDDSALAILTKCLVGIMHDRVWIVRLIMGFSFTGLVFFELTFGTCSQKKEMTKKFAFNSDIQTKNKYFYWSRGLTVIN